MLARLGSLVMVATVALVWFWAPPAQAVNVFGGQASQVIPCYNNVIWTLLGPPRGGRFIWAPGITKTYEYGPPNHAGQWMLGLYGAPYFCIVSVSPIIIFPGDIMLMMGSSR